MSNIITEFKLTNNQGDYLEQNQVDFVNIRLGYDNPFFLDYNNIMSSNSKHALKMRKTLDSFSFHLGSMLLTNKKKLPEFLSNIHETNSTHLGWSNGKPDGTSIGPVLCKSLIGSLDEYKTIYTSGNFNFNTMQFTTKQIASDRCSDIITSVCKLDLIDYTIEQCVKYGIKTDKSVSIKYYDAKNNEWNVKHVFLPSYNNEELIFIPKDIVTSNGNYNFSFTRLMTLGLKELVNVYSAFVELKRNNNKLKLSKKMMRHLFHQMGYDDKDIIRIIFKELSKDSLNKILSDINSRKFNLSDDEIINIISMRFKESA